MEIRNRNPASVVLASGKGDAAFIHLLKNIFMMKKMLFLMLLIATILTFTACASGDEIWGLRIGQSRESIAKQLKDQGYTIENFLDNSYLSVDDKVEYQGITWDAVTCWFDDNNKLKSVQFDTYGSRPDYQIEKLYKYIKEEGYPELKEDEKIRGFYMSDKLDMTVILSIMGGTYGRIHLEYCKDAHKNEN